MRLSVLLLAACTTAMANVPLAENSRLGSLDLANHSHQGIGPAKALHATGIAGCLCDERRRSRSTSKERDAETGLDYFGARYFSGAQGRFTSPDWSAAPQPVPYADFSDPQTLNLYSYVRNNPLAHNDPDGHCLRPGVSCLDYAIGGLKAGSNVLSDAATLLNRGINRLTGSNIPDAARFEGTNSDQREGMHAFTVVLVASPLAEAGAAKLVDVIGTGAKVESAVVGGMAKVGEAGGPGAGKPFANSVKDAARAESNDTCVFCKQETARTPGPNQSNIDHSIPKSRNGNNSLNNAQNTCRTCNLDKGTKTTPEYQEELRRRSGGN